MQLGGTTSAVQTVTLTNHGSTALAITSVAVGGSNGSDFAEMNTCGVPVAPSSSCTISLTFTPTAAGTRTASLAITDNATGSPQTVSLSGTGVAASPTITFTSTSLTFSAQLVGTSAAAQPVTLTNSGTATLGITSITVGGTNSGDFAETNTCGTSVAASSSCIINVTFTPTAAGTRTASLAFTDNATASPQTVALTGAGTDFSFGVASGGSTMATVTAGQTATYNLQIAPSGFSGTVTLSCTGAPAKATCSVSPASVMLGGATTSPFTVSVSTASRSMVVPRTIPLLTWPRGDLPLALAALLLTLALGMTFAVLKANRWKFTLILPSVMLFGVVLLPGCGGGVSSAPSSPAPPTVTGTPAGSYTVTVTGTSGSASRNISLTLIVN